MHEAKQIERIDPAAGIPGGEVAIECSDHFPNGPRSLTVWFHDQVAHVVAATPHRALVLVPELSLGAKIEVSVDSVGRLPGKPAHFIVAGKMADGIHPVTSPAFDPADGAPVIRASFYRHWPRYYYVTRSKADLMRQ